VTIEYLIHQAQERPQAIALIEGDREIRYAEFTRDLWKFTRAVQGLKLPRGGSVAIGCDDFYTHWLLILAFERLGVATSSFDSNEVHGARVLLGSVDLVLAEPHFPMGGWATRAITADWVQAVLSRSDDGPVPAAPKQPDDVIRIVRTSGTTGNPKRFPLLRRMSEARKGRYLWLYRGWPAETRSLVTFSLSIGLTYTTAMTALRWGQTLVVARDLAMAELPALIVRHRIGRLALLPVQLKQVLDHLPPGWVKPERLEVSSYGAPVAEELRRAALGSLASLVTEIYASNEFGIVSVTRQPDSGGFGMICPDVEVEIVDDQDRPVPDGTIGHVRVRSESAFRGYLGDPTLSRRMLRQGWFYSGDVGVLDGRRLHLVGRSDDQVNLGGVKHPITRLEAVVQASGGAGVKDVGIIPVANAAGITEIHVGVVTDGRHDRAVLDRIIASLRTMVPSGYHLVRLPQIPRNEMGKIDRARLKEALLAPLPG
jgi:2,3-dihydroxybenzoate-AMP ligase